MDTERGTIYEEQVRDEVGSKKQDVDVDGLKS
jgi:hypothetical protein